MPDPVQSVEESGQLAAAVIGEVRLEPDQLFEHPVGLAASEGGEGGGDEGAAARARKGLTPDEQGKNPDPEGNDQHA
jgi:hypothetical protein